ncbi:GNAT family N-acetyltransferase [Caballeronia humi]|jgi:GNAT superfamily N-acetyltransferase|uniref:Acetyltransferase n=1 Tax=Caballeronia humi TaxID=326474 RepID=A0A158JE95_9BURK|nr:GNAT family N-acetyltransferase [Caballeronia humi]SAL66813.1 acetyltransferase [Caballeronia humi]
MTLPAWHEEAIGREHDRDAFDCTDGELNQYLKKYARQNHENGGAKTFLAIEDESGRILGYYTLAPSSAVYDQTPEAARKGLPRHPVPGFRLARLATDKSVGGQGLGTQLILAAGRRCIRVAGEVGGVALFIDAKSERAAKWYEERGALRLVGVPEGLPIPMLISLKTIAAALNAADQL